MLIHQALLQHNSIDWRTKSNFDDNLKMND